MMSIEQLATFLARSALVARHEMTEAMKAHMDHVAEDARAIVGQERQEWPSLAPSTMEEKERLGFKGQVSETDPVLRTGGLRDSIKSEVVETADGVEGIVGSDSKVAAIQEHGSSRIPPRPFTSIALRNAEEHAKERFGHLGIHLTNPNARILPK